ncbi:MAG: PmoA family protein [Bacteroidetes bacterium]|nr:PmoA family protein [Bacteroidota bacterium]MDA1121238.1 PmoA family protein [Bacteroidota bacterium]
MRYSPFILCLLLISCESNQYTLTIIAGEIDRNGSIVQFIFPGGVAHPGDWELVNDETAKALPVQKVNDVELALILDEPLEANTERSYTLRQSEKSVITMLAYNNGEDLELKSGDNPLLTFNVATDYPPKDQPQYYRRSGYIHPMYSPGGAIVSDGFPVGHTHQHGVFLAWVNTTFRGDSTDFWNQQLETGTVTVAHKELSLTSAGSVFTGFSQELAHSSTKHGQVLEEWWDVTAFDLDDYYVFDLISSQKNITLDTLYINKYHYGGLAIRGSKMWNYADSLSFKDSAKVLTSEGKTRVEANHTRPLWMAMYGATEKGVAGIAVFDSPDNFRHPQPVRVHPEMPYFCMAPMVEGTMSIAPDATYQSRYRIVTFDGQPNVRQLDAMWADYASPVMVE